MNETDTKSDNSYEALVEAESASDNHQNNEVLDGQESREPLKKPRRKYGKFALGFTALSALIIGGASGGGFVQYVMPYFTGTKANSPNPNTGPRIDLTPIEAQISRLTDKNTQIDTQISRLEAAYKRLDRLAKDAKPIAADPIDLSGLEIRLDALENAPQATPIDESLLARLESLQNEGSPALDLSDIEARLAELETQLASEDIPEPIRELVQDIYEKQTETQLEIEALSDELKTQQAQLMPSADKPLALAVSDFPKRALLDALSQQSQKQPLLQRTLGKHIKIKDPADPAVLIEAIETALDEGNIEAARAQFDRLPPDIRLAGQAWRDALN